MHTPGRTGYPLTPHPNRNKPPHPPPSTGDGTPPPLTPAPYHHHHYPARHRLLNHSFAVGRTPQSESPAGVGRGRVGELHGHERCVGRVVGTPSTYNQRPKDDGQTDHWTRRGEKGERTLAPSITSMHRSISFPTRTQDRPLCGGDRGGDNDQQGDGERDSSARGEEGNVGRHGGWWYGGVRRGTGPARG